MAKVKDMLEGGGEAGLMTKQPRYSAALSVQLTLMCFLCQNSVFYQSV